MFRQRLAAATGTLGLASVVGLSAVAGTASGAAVARSSPSRATTNTVAVLPHVTAEQENGHTNRRSGRDPQDIPSAGDTKGYAVRIVTGG